MAQKIKVQQYDNGIKLYFKIKKDNIVEPLTGASIFLKLKGLETGSEVTKECTITDAELGECVYILTTQDLMIAESFLSEIEVRYKTGTILSYDNPVILTVTPQNINS